MADLKRVTYCGLYCGLCLNGGRIPARATELRELLARVKVEQWGPDLPGYEGFRTFLEGLADFGPRASCRERTCGLEDCAIRTCAEGRSVVACPLCPDYPCERIDTLAKRYPMLLCDGLRLREVGVETWVKEQEERKARGFSYVDIRYEPAGPPAA
mgnify:CR=1 FL=1